MGTCWVIISSWPFLCLFLTIAKLLQPFQGTSSQFSCLTVGILVLNPSWLATPCYPATPWYISPPGTKKTQTLPPNTPKVWTWLLTYAPKPKNFINDSFNGNWNQVCIYQFSLRLHFTQFDTDSGEHCTPQWGPIIKASELPFSRSISTTSSSHQPMPEAPTCPDVKVPKVPKYRLWVW